MLSAFPLLMMYGPLLMAVSPPSPRQGLCRSVISNQPLKRALCLLIADYFQKVEQLVDTLAAVHDQPLDDFENIPIQGMD